MGEKTVVGGIPVECLTGEPAAIWTGWRTLGDKELVREASAKGTHINLAHKCIAFRQICSIEDAQHYFNKEVEIWITELLQKRQIYRASHILQNMKKDPVDYIFEVCIHCKDLALRNYLAEYLISVARFEAEHIDSWNIIKYLEKFEEKHMIQDGVSTNLCIENMIKVPDHIKQALCTELYFSVKEHNLLTNVTNTVLWDYLLSNNKVEMIKCWIDIQYNGSSIEQSNDIAEEYRSLFATMNIGTDMHEHIDSSNATDLVKDLVKNHLCRYGIFVQKEKENIKLMLARIFGSAMTLSQFDTALSCKASNIDKNEFFETVDRELRFARCLNEIHTEQDEEKIVKLFSVLTKLCNDQEQFEDTLIEALFETIHYLSNDVNEFLKQNYLIVLLLIFVYLLKENRANNQSNCTAMKGSILKDIFTRKDDLQVGHYNISNEVLQNTLKQIPILQYIIENKPKKEATMYELLDGYKNLNVEQLFKWRFSNEPMPRFSNETLVKKYGHAESLTYEYYLKEARPSMAILSLKQRQGKRVKSVFSRRKCKASFYAHILALRNLEKPEIVCSCISFIEMLSLNSENLRLHVTAANYIQKKMSVPIGNLLENILYENENDLKAVISYFESSFQKDICDDLVENSQQFVNMLKIWDIVVRFARSHSTSSPASFLKFLASKNHWFEFLLVCQLFSYPTDQVLENAKYFEDAILREHLLTCLSNTRLTKEQSAIHIDQKLKSRDVRQSLYHKVGVKQSGSLTSGSSASTDSSSVSDSCSTHEYTVNDSVCTVDDDLWLIILKCHQSPDPPGALISASLLTLKPFLTVLATCYEPSSTATYSYSWMIISTADENIISEYKNCLEQQIWTANHVFNLLNKMVTHGYISTLSRAYKIFMPESTFNAYFEFLAQCTLYGDFEESEQYLLKFKNQCLNLRSNKAIDWNCSDGSYLNNLDWVTMVAVKCILATLACSLTSTHLQIEFLNTLIKCDFHADSQVCTPNFQRLLQIVKILQKTNIVFNCMNCTISGDVFDFNPEIQRYIDDLLRAESYDSALELSTAANLNSSNIILAQYRHKFEHCIQGNRMVENEFWVECAQNFEKYKVAYAKTVEFFIEHAEKVASHQGRYEILRLAFETLKNVDTEQQNIDTLEMAMWKSCMLADLENIQLGSGPRVFNKLKTELLSGLDKLEFSYTLNEPYERSAAEKLINKLIDLNKIDIALRISSIFNYKHKDLEILMLCLSLVEGEITPNNLSIDQKNLLKDLNKTKQQKYGAFKHRGLQRFSSSSSLTTSTSLSETSKHKDANYQNMQMDCLTTLQTLLKSLEHGQDVCLKIVLYYKLAMQLEKSYGFLLTLNDPTQFLQEIAESNIENKLDVFADIITAYNINNNTVATFLAENITANIGRAIEDGEEGNIYLWGYCLNSNFRVIMELCNDVPLLGYQLLKRANRLLRHSPCEKLSTLKMIVELLIRSHDCFTTSCNMEGIASILRKCQNLANTLQNLKLWTLLVRLVTGVGRFTEMNYIFQILKENHQFECLLGKGLDKVPGLKIALLEFLKRSSPQNKDLFTLVALHFQLYHEMAVTWESEAKDIINALVSSAAKDQGKPPNSAQQEIKLAKTDHIQQQLQLAVSNFTYATQYYLREKTLNLANWCSNQAQLVGFQLSLFNTVSNNQEVICILNLKSEDIDRILCHTLNFSQALIVIHAYNFPVDWTNLIYNHCILSGEMKYLKDFMTVEKLTTSLVQDCARRYRLEKGITHTMTDNMKMLISELSDIECKYMLASQLGFKTIVESMLNNPMIVAYLKDTVWKKGYSMM